MMIGPEFYKEGLKRKSYLELMKERERLLSFMHEFEANEIAGDRSSPDWHAHPLPSVMYQVYFDYLSVLCGVMHEKYNREYISGSRTLKKDAEAEADKSRVMYEQENDG